MGRRIQIILTAVLLAVILFCMIFVPEIKKNIEAAEHERRTEETVQLVEKMPAYIREAVMAYNDLTDTADITYEMLDAVTSLRIMYGQCVEVTINCEPFGSVFGPYVKPNRMEQLYFARVPEKSTEYNKLNAFFQLADLNEPAIQNDKVMRIKKYYPEAENGAFYVFDPFSSQHEIALIFAILEKYIFTNDELTYERTLDLSSLSAFKNLVYVEYFINQNDLDAFDSREAYDAARGLTFENCPVEIRTAVGIYEHEKRLREN